MADVIKTGRIELRVSEAERRDVVSLVALLGAAARRDGIPHRYSSSEAILVAVKTLILQMRDKV